MSRPDSIWITLRRCVADLFALLRLRLVLAIGLIVLITLTEGAGILVLVPILEVAGLGGGSTVALTGTIRSAFAAIGLQPSLTVLLASFVFITAGRAVLLRWQTINLASITEQFVHHLRMRLYRAFVRARYEYITRIRVSDFIHALTDETGRAAAITNQLVHLCGQTTVTAVFVAIALRISWQATAVAVACATLVFVALWRRARQSVTAGRALSLTGARLVSVASEHMAGIKTTRSYRAEDTHEQAFRSFSEQAGEAGVDSSRHYADVSMRFQIASSALAALVIYVALVWLALPAGALLLLIIIMSRLVPRFASFQNGVQSLLHALPAYARVHQLVSEADAHPELVTPSRPGVVDRSPLAGDIVFESVSFAYASRTEGGEIHDVSLRIPRGKTTAIIGPSGAGKSTVADLLTGLLTPSDGRIVLGNTTLDAGRMEWWRTRLGYVAQDTFLFHDTVRVNLAWVNPEATEEEVWQALARARAADFVRRLPGGLDTLIGDRGVQLSGGERQRLALARALLRRPDVLILDEATSALDAENERAIYEALDQLHGSLTVVMITHRLATVRHVDLVYEMNQGRIVASGRPEEVLDR